MQISVLAEPMHTGAQVIVASYRSLWIREVGKLGWDRVGRLRHRSLMKPCEGRDEVDWMHPKAIMAKDKT